MIDDAFVFVTAWRTSIIRPEERIGKRLA